MGDGKTVLYPNDLDEALANPVGEKFETFKLSDVIRE